MRPQADVALVAEDRPREGQQRALQVAERQVLVDRQALDLVELGRVRGVVVGPVDAARDDDVQRRRLQLHRAHLHRRGLRAQDHVVGDVEGVRLRPRRVVRVVVERVEVVVGEVDLRALDDPVAEPDEDVLDLAPRGGEDVQVPGGVTGVPGSVTSTTSAASCGSSSSASSSPARASIADCSAWRAWLAPLPTGPRSSGGSLPTSRNRLGSSALRPRKRTRTSSSSAVPAAAATAASPRRAVRRSGRRCSWAVILFSS